MFWNWEASVLNIVGLHLIAFGSIERYLFVFHGQFLTRYRLLVSKIPMAFSVVYPFAFYTSFIYGSWWCTNTYDYSSLACGVPCYLVTSTFLLPFGILTHHVLPVFTVLFSNTLLVIRVWQQKGRMNQANTWKRNIQMSVQLLSIAFIYLLVWLPQCILFLMISYGSSQLQAIAGSLIYEYTGNFTSLTVFFCPFMALGGLPQIRNRIKEDIRKLFGIQNRVGPNRVVPTNETKRMATNRL